MADGVPDFADLLAAFEEAPAVNLQQISHGANSHHRNNVQLGANPSLHYNQQLGFNQNQRNFANSAGFATQNQLGQISALQQGSQINQAFAAPAVTQSNSTVTDDSMGSGSLGLMFLSDVESQLSDEGSTLAMSISQPAYPPQAAQIRPTQQRPRQRQKQSNAQSKRSNLQSNRMSQNVGSPSNIQAGNIGQVSRGPIQNFPSQNTVSGSGPKMSASVASPPFVIPSDVQSQPGQQKVGLPMGQFVHPSMHGARQSGQQLPNPPRPLSATSSTSDHLSRPGSVPQPSPSCGSNHSGDPATPLTPQSYNAGTPQSYNPGTPQSISMNQQQRQRNPGYSDVSHSQQQMGNQSIILSDDSFTSHQRPGSVHTQPSPIAPINTSNDTFSDFPTPLKEAFIPHSGVEAFTESNLSSFENTVMRGNSGAIANQPWMQNMNNQNSAIMPPDALFTNNASAKEIPNPNSTNSQQNYMFDPNSFATMQSSNHYFQRTETNVGTASLTSKQNELLDQLSSFGKSKSKQTNFVQQDPLDILDHNATSVATTQYSTGSSKSNSVFGGNSGQGKTATMNLMNKANDAGAAAVKELFQSHYEAISPVSDYAMSPANKSSLQDELPESLLFSPTKFTSQKHDLPIGHDLSSKSSDALNDPVLMYLKQDKKQNAKIDPLFFPQSQNDSFDTSMPKNDWATQFLDANNKDVNSSPAVSSYIGIQQNFTSTVQSTLSSFMPSSVTSAGVANNAAWTPNPIDNLISNPITQHTVSKPANAQSYPIERTRNVSSDLWKELQLSPQKKKTSKNSENTNKQSNFGVSRRKSSTERAKTVGKGKKSSSFENEFGFDSDDDAEPTICLKKGDTKSKKGFNSGSKPEPPNNIKTTTHNALAGGDLMNQMETLKKLQQQQQMLIQMQEFQLRHGTNTKAAAAHSMHLSALSHAPVSKSYTESYKTPVYPKDSMSSIVPKFPTLPVLSSKKTNDQQHKKQPLPDFSTSMSHVRSSVPRSDTVPTHLIDNVTSHEKVRSVPQSVVTTTSSSAKFLQSSVVHHPSLPQFQSFLDNPLTTSSRLPEQVIQTPAQISQFPLSHDIPINTASSVTPVGLSQPHKHLTLYFPPSTTSSTSILPLYSAPSSIPPPTKTTSQNNAVTCHNTTSAVSSVSRNNNTASVTATPGLMQPAVSDHFSNRPQPFDSTHFDMEWLHREPQSHSSDNVKVSVTKPHVTPAKVPLPISQNYVTPAEKYNLPVLTTTNVNKFTSAPVVATTNTNKLPFDSMKDDKVIPLKQSIHTVHHISVPKSQPLSTVTTSFSASIFNKDSVAVASTETKHLNLKKHRILEGYPHSTEVFKSSNKAVITSQANGIPATIAQSVLDKQRRYSKEHAAKKTSHRVGVNAQSQGNKSPLKSAKNQALGSQIVTTSQTTVTEAAKSSTAMNQSTNMEKVKIEKKEQKAKGGQSGSMLSFFNSLLQEASESAADSLKVSNDPMDSENTKENKQEAVIIKNTEVPKSSLESKTAGNPVKTTVPHTIKAVITTSITTASVNTTPSVQTTVSSLKKPPKKHRPAATVPFKRRPYPAIDDLEATKVPILIPLPVLPIPVPSTLSSSVKVSPSVLSSSGKVSPSVLPKKLAPTIVVSTVTAPISIASPVINASATASSKPQSPASVEVVDNAGISLPKLRITMFRSSKGQVIHQSSMVGSNTEASNVDSDHSVHRKHKKKKKRKRKRKLSSSSSVSSMTSMSSLEPAAKLVQQAAKLEEMAAKHLSKVVLPVTTSKDLPIISPAKETVPKATDSEILKIAPKRKRTKGGATENPDKKKSVKRVKVTKPSAKKKSEAKNVEPIARYQPKSFINATTHTTVTTKAPVTLPSAFRRAPGKLPSYLITSEAQSATVPTIQLVARNTKLLDTVVDKISQPSTVVNVKITNTMAGKTFPTQLIGNTGVQYIIPGGKGQQRILLPNISTPISVPVSIVSPLLGRASNGGKTQFSVPLNMNNPSKTTTSKPSKFRSQQASVSKHTSVIMSQSTTNFLSAQTILSGTGSSSGPRVTTKVSSTLLQPLNPANSFQSTFSKLISSQNPIPTYVPPIPPEDLKMDLNDRQQHQCLECKDTFIFNESLECHYDRKCILIKVRCMQCNQNLLFLNKCKLLLHARQHSDKGGGMQFNNAHISPLPFSLCKPRSKEDFLHKSAAYERRKSSLTSSEDDNSFMNSSSSCASAVSCTDCNFIAVSTEALEEHYQRHSPPPSPDSNAGQKQSQCFTCDICSLPIPNQCSFNAHMRMHKRTAPHTCPECGQTFDNDGAKDSLGSENKKEIDFNLHLSIQCFHLSRMSCYKCRLCSSIFKNAELLRRHLEVRHLQTFYKCKDCPMAFKTIENITSHQRSAHSIVAATKMIHKCPLCDTVFTDNSPTQQLFLLQKHFEGHINHPSINITAYKCLFCNNIYERKSLLREHLKTAHDVMSAGESDCELTKEINETKILLEKSKKDEGMKKLLPKKKNSSKLTTKEPLAKIPKILSPNRADAAVTNLRIASGILGNMDGSGTSKKSLLSGKITGASAAMMKNARQPLKLRLKGMTANSLSTGAGTSGENSGMLDSDETICNVPSIIKDGRKVYPCGECSKELPSVSARLNHIKLKHKGIRTLYCCPHCPVDKIKFAKKISLKKHLRKFHGVEEMKKQDVKIEYVKVPVGQRFDPSTFNFGKEAVQQESSSLPEVSGGMVENKVRKKITALGRKSAGDKLVKRPVRQVRRDLENNSPYLDNSDSEVEQITNRCAKEIVKSDAESLDFSLLRFPEVYTCAKCQYQSKDRLEFQAHIVEHREEAECAEMLSSMRQCTECGLCFASLGSHAKHMFIKHKIKKRKLLEQYDQKLRAERQANGSLLQPSEGSSNKQNGSGTKMHRCSVCYRRFDDEGRLKTHMRTHGLAFVKSKHIS